jgi:hypothetical protein
MNCNKDDAFFAVHHTPNHAVCPKVRAYWPCKSRWKDLMIESVSSIASGRISAMALILLVLVPFSVTEGNTAGVVHLQNLDLIISHFQTQLLNTALNGVPTS